jgi:hypothetical protein
MFMCVLGGFPTCTLIHVHALKGFVPANPSKHYAKQNLVLRCLVVVHAFQIEARAHADKH